ncbi:MAG: hypothetical protein Q4C91_03940 [Eubacteriales bacterium]|nr:hypothetical protein [Eubacteriales bacterium]
MKGLKKAFCVFGTAMCLLGSTVTASADTIQFNVTYPGDQYSYTVRKADSEQRFYVTGTSFSRTGRLYCTSHKVSDHSVSGSTSITPSSPSSSGAYGKYAKAKEQYELYTTASVSGLNVIGRYTP